jgi:hypothetical protein
MLEEGNLNSQKPPGSKPGLLAKKWPAFRKVVVGLVLFLVFSCLFVVVFSLQNRVGEYLFVVLLLCLMGGMVWRWARSTDPYLAVAG